MMNDASAARTPWHLWAVGLLSLVWNGLGGFDYVMMKTRNAAYLAGFPAEQRAWFDSYPLWMNAAWALGVWTAILGSLLLLLRSRWAVHAFVVSLAGLAVATAYQFGSGTMPESLRTKADMIFTACLWAVAAFLIWYALRERARGALR
jgi:hypothetical protein